MTEILTKAVWNGDTGQTEIIPLTAEELAEREERIAAGIAAAAAEEALAAERLAVAESAKAKLKALNFTDAEIAALSSQL